MTILPATGGTGRRPPTPEAAELRAARAKIIEALNDSPLIALSIYEDAVMNTVWPRVRATLIDIFGNTMKYIAPARTISAASIREELPRMYAPARQNDRRTLAASVADRLVEMGRNGEVEALEAIGKQFQALVVSETVHQQFVCKLAVRLAFKEHSDALATYVREPLIDALRRALRVGAPAIRDAVVEGLGGLLKFYEKPEERFPRSHRNPVTHRADLEADYERRFERHRQMVLVVAGHSESQTALFAALDTPPSDARRRAGRPVKGIESELRARADLLRTLTAMCRQAVDRPAMTSRAVAYLVVAAAPPDVGDSEPAEVHAAMARFQESVFRTIEVMIVRGVDPKSFDRALSGAVAALPRTIAGKPALCNAQARATVAVLDAAAVLVARAADSDTESQLAPLFKTLGSPGSSWTNPGIVEGCYGALPALLSSRFRDVWTEPALEALFASLRKPHRAADFVSTHRQLVANASFRRLLITLSDRLHELYRYVDDVNDEGKYAMGVERAMRALLNAPSAKLVLTVFHAQSPGAALRSAAPRGVAESVIAATSFENELLERGEELFREWKALPPRRQLLLTRILGLLLQASWRDSRGVVRNALLKFVYDELPTVARSEDERRNEIRRLLAELPADAAAALDAELQDFVAECGARADESGNRSAYRNELPGHVLAMVDSTASPRIAATIAREIELNLKAARLENPRFDFAKLLYQVMLRGPDESIFEHLLPRLDDPTDARLVALYQLHVTKVRSCQVLPNKNVDFKELRTRLAEIVEHLGAWQTGGTTTLDQLHDALQIYKRLSADDQTLWASIIEEPAGAEGRGLLGELFDKLDGIAADTHTNVALGRPDEEHPSQRQSLEPLCREWLVLLRSHVAHYLELRVHDFSDRRDALERAIRVTQQIEALLVEHGGLQPPERILLVALLQRLRDVFERTIVWYCEGPRHCIDPEAFWSWYALEPENALHAEKLLRDKAPDDPDRATLLRMRPSPTERPPSFPKQQRGFQRYFVDWMSAELDIDRLKWALSGSWSLFFKLGYGVITRWWLMGPIILAQCGLAAYLHHQGRHAIEGVGFAAVAVVSIVVALIYLSAFVARIRWRYDAATGKGPKYRFEALMPRLLKLIVVPLVLIVDFEHSYTFPMNASNAVLLLLMLVAYMSTRFVAERELVVDPAHSRSTRPKRGRSARVRQIVSVALAQSFIVSLLFSVIFGSNHVDEIPVPDRFQELSEAAEEAHDAKEPIVQLANHLDAIPDGHARPRLFGLVPRETQFDVAALVDGWGLSIDERVAPHFRFVFYPPLILAWTALGLFFGVFLEGFLKGERLRGEMATEES